ncbi:MAG: response regulator transcription factor [Burkholderiaceae bacterium]|jgi:DNA-binding NarL/FixJ family response regulator|nr:response regulator transcription factor [Burkholderiaceae bacterium]MEB2317838.1 response regulator transcription factor [Pseudomonadota bacterium]
MIRVILVDDHQLVRRGVRETLIEAGGFEIVGEAAGYAELRELLRTVQADVVVLDINLPGRSGLEILKSLDEAGSRMRVVMLSQYPEDQYGVRALKAGAMAYLNKTSTPETIVEALRMVATGRKFVTREIAHALMESVTGRHDDEPHQALSERERQTMMLIASGKRLSEIAEALALSPKTVSVYRARVLEKLGLATNAELAAYAVRNRLID